MWSRLGADVTVIEGLNQICTGIDLEVGKHFQRSLKRQGLKFHLGASVKEGKKTDKGVEIIFEDKSKKTHTVRLFLFLYRNVF